MLNQPTVTAGLRLRKLMDNLPKPSPLRPQKDYLQYDHTDSCSFQRWTARESFQFMHARPWQMVNDFYLDAVNGRISLPELFGKKLLDGVNGRISLPELFGKKGCAVHDDTETVEICDNSDLVNGGTKQKTGKQARVTFKIVLSYHGGSFDGWQKQPGLNTVQGFIESSLGRFVDEKKMQMLKEKNLPTNVCAVVAGRTDKGVTALQQVCSFYTWRKDVEVQEIEDAINSVIPDKIRAISVSQVARAFHPNFSAKWRHYFYVFPLDEENVDEQTNQSDMSDCEDLHHMKNGEENNRNIADQKDSHIQEERKKPTRFEVSKVNILLNKLEGKQLSYKLFARDTKASRNDGPPTECFVFHARATEVNLPCKKDGTSKKTMCVELVANRFLRKMVRVLVATAIREVAAGAEEDALLKLMDATCRRATAPPAPPNGLCLVGVGYKNFDRKCCLIV